MKTKGSFVLLILILLFGINYVMQDIKAKSTGNISVTIFQGTDIETEIEFQWEIDYDVWISDNSYDVRIQWSTTAIGGNFFDGTYSFSSRIKNLTSFASFAGGGGNIPADTSQFTTKIDVGVLDNNFVDHTFVQFRIHVNDKNKGEQTDDYDVIPITVVGSALHTQTETVFSNNTVTSTVNHTITQQDRITSTEFVTETVNKTNTILVSNSKSEVNFTGYIMIFLPLVTMLLIHCTKRTG